MTAKPKAPGTAHLRSKIRKIVHVHGGRSLPGPHGKKSGEGITNAIRRVKNGSFGPWIEVPKIPSCSAPDDGKYKASGGSPLEEPSPAFYNVHGNRKNVRAEGLDHEVDLSCNARPTPTDAQSIQQVDALRDTLKLVADDMSSKKRPYAAIAALAARTLVKIGRTDDINAGLWPLVNRVRHGKSKPHL